MGDTRDGGQAQQQFAGAANFGPQRQAIFAQRFNGGMGPPNMTMQGGQMMSGPTPLNTGMTGPLGFPQFGRGNNAFSWFGSQTPVLDRNPINANFLGMLNGRRFFGPNDSGYGGS